jgi:hypothetical protein
MKEVQPRYEKIRMKAPDRFVFVARKPSGELVERPLTRFSLSMKPPPPRFGSKA